MLKNIILIFHNYFLIQQQILGSDHDYNQIPGFDFFGNNAGQVNVTTAASTCDTDITCVGYNSAGYYKNQLQNPYSTKNYNFYVHTVQLGINFIQLQGWESMGNDMAEMPLTVASVSACAYQCTITSGCVGAVWDDISQCWLKTGFNTPSSNIKRNLLLPVGVSCPPTFVSNNGICIPSPNSLTTVSDAPTSVPTISKIPSMAPTVSRLPTFAPVTAGQIGNSGFEAGLGYWTSKGSTSTVNSGCYSGSCVMVGATTPTNGDSSISQTFTTSGKQNQLTFWYKMTCPDTIGYDWATATLYDNTLGSTSWTMPKVCPGTSGMSWSLMSANVITGHSYTLTLISHDDNWSSDPSYTLFDNIVLFNGTVAPSVAPNFSPTMAPSMSPVAFTSSLRILSAANKCLDIFNNNQVSGQAINERDCNGGDSQIFTFTSLSVGTYKITSSQGLCVDVAGASTTNGAVVDLQTCNGQPNQMWTVNDLGNNLFHLQPVNGISLNKCLDNASGSTANGNKIEIWDCNNNPASQTWSFSMPLVTGKVYVKVYYFYVPFFSISFFYLSRISNRRCNHIHFAFDAMLVQS